LQGLSSVGLRRLNPRREWIVPQQHNIKDARHWLVRAHRGKDDSLLLEEYKTIRAEVTASIQAQISILAFGAATLGFSFAAASQTSNTGFRGMFLLVLVPLISYLILIVWFSEVMRMMRAGAFLMRLEKRFDEEFQRGALTWESTIFQVRCKSRQRTFFEDPDTLRTFAITALFFGIALTSIAIGWGSVSAYKWEHWVAVLAFAAAASVVVRLYVLRQGDIHRLARPRLKRDATGPRVKRLQKVLKDAGLYVGGDALQGVDTATTVRVRDGQTQITDGPFEETKAVLGGYYLVDAPDLDTVLEYAARVPNVWYGSLEVRPVWQFDETPSARAAQEAARA
jgi:hypothetical protein